MAYRKISDDKIRLAVTVDRKTIEQFRADLEILRLPSGTLSGLVDEWLQNFAPTLHIMAERKQRGEQMTFNDVIEVMADTIRAAGKP